MTHPDPPAQAADEFQRLARAASQDQFLEVIDCAEAHRRFRSQLRLEPLGAEMVPLADALDRILAEDVVAGIDVPGFDRSNVDGFAVQAADTFGASEVAPCRLRLNSEVLSPGISPQQLVSPGTTTSVATGAVLPRGADAIVMVEYTDLESMVPARGGREPRGSIAHPADTNPDLMVAVTRPVSPGDHVAFAGTDIARGETILRAGQILTSREIGVLAAIGASSVSVVIRPRVAILSTGDEIIAPGEPLRVGAVYDSNAAILAASVRELGGEPISLGIAADDEAALSSRLAEALQYDAVLLSGGTSKGAGDLSYRVVSRLGSPGIVAHGVALKPGKPVCLAVVDRKPVVILPGFPTSAIFTFHEFVAPVLRALAGRGDPDRAQVSAVLPMRVNSERGRTEYLLVSLVRMPQLVAETARFGAPTLAASATESMYAFPMGKGSGSVTTFSNADGFITIDQHTEILEAGTPVTVQLLGSHVAPAGLVVIGSHCVGLDYLLGQVQRRGHLVKSLHVGSTAGLTAAGRGQCDLAGIHLLDPATGEYNRPFLTPELELIPGYRRMQGIVFRRGDARFENRSPAEALAAALHDPGCRMINRNTGSGTRILFDRLLQDVTDLPASRIPPGYAVQAKSHNAVAAAIQQQRADWGIAIETVARDYDLGFIPVREEHYDFVTPRNRANSPAIQAFRQLLSEPVTRTHLISLGFHL